MFVYIIDRDGEPDVYAALADAELASEILGASDPDEAIRYGVIEQSVFAPSSEDQETRDWLENLRADYPPQEE
jgi:hypothetical protein